MPKGGRRKARSGAKSKISHERIWKKRSHEAGAGGLGKKMGSRGEVRLTNCEWRSNKGNGKKREEHIHTAREPPGPKKEKGKAGLWVGQIQDGGGKKRE